MVFSRAFASTVFSLAAAGLAVPVWADVSDLPPAQQALWNKPVTAPLSHGKVLLLRTEEALPPPSQAELDAKLKELAAEAARKAAGKVQTEVAQKQSELDARLTNMAKSTAAKTAEMVARADTTYQSLTRQQLQTEENAKEYARLQAMLAQTTAQRDALVAARQEAQQAETRAQQNIAAQKAVTDARLSSLERLSDNNRQIADLQTRLVEAQLKAYADAQLAQLTATTSATLAHMAASTQSGMADIRTETAKHLTSVILAARAQAAQLAEEKSAFVAKQVAVLQSQVEHDKQKSLTPEAVQAIATQTVAAAQPEFRALALNAMKDGQDYIKTVARGLIQDKDPAVADALRDTVKDVIVKDDKVVFAMRKALENSIQQQAIAVASPTIKLGNGWKDPSVLPSVPTPQVATNDAMLAALSPAAGGAPNSQDATRALQALLPSGMNQVSIQRAHNRTDLGDLRQYRVIIHSDNQTLESILGGILSKAEPMVGPWQVKWKIGEDNKDILSERFSLDAETTFDEFIAYLAQYMGNERGVKLSFSLFDAERIIVVSD
jgi:hypothetical protein